MGGDVEVASGRPVGVSRAAFARAGIPGSTVPPCAIYRIYFDDSAGASAGASFFTGFCSV